MSRRQSLIVKYKLFIVLTLFKDNYKNIETMGKIVKKKCLAEDLKEQRLLITENEQLKDPGKKSSNHCLEFPVKIKKT